MPKFKQDEQEKLLPISEGTGHPAEQNAFKLHVKLEKEPEEEDENGDDHRRPDAGNGDDHYGGEYPRKGSFQDRTSQDAAQSPHSLPFGLKEEEWVDSVAPVTDDPHTPALTWRVLILGIVWSVFLATANTLFSFRKNHFRIPVGVVVLLAFPMGRFLEVVLPSAKFLGLELNPGIFTVKEHVLIALIAYAAGGRPLAVDNIVVQYSEQYLNDPSVNVWNGLAWILVTQMIGFGLSGLYRDFLVRPPSMVWPQILPSVAMFTSFHRQHTMEGDDDNISTGPSTFKMSRMSWFWMVFACIFVYQWIPQYFMMSIQLVSVLCFMSSNRNVRLLGSGDTFEGPSILGLSFDWSVMDHHSPLTTPFWASINFFVHSVFWGWIVTPILFFYSPFGPSPVLESRKGWNGADPLDDPFPVINSNLVYDRFGKEVKVSAFVVNGTSHSATSPAFVQEMIDSRGPFYLSAIFIVSYVCSFMNISAIISHVGLWYGSDIWLQTRAAFASYFGGRSGRYRPAPTSMDGGAGSKDKDYLPSPPRPTHTSGWEDVHNKLMRAYVDVPGWAYVVWLTVFTILLLLVTSFTPFKMPPWATLLAIFIGGSLSLPIGIISAVSGSRLGLNVLTELIIGYLLPGDIVAVMAFKSVGYNCMIQCLHLLSDLKLAHYMHISPIVVVSCQILGTLIGGVCSTTTLFWTMNTFREDLTRAGGNWAATSYRTFAMAGAIWGSIGPARFFGPGTPYNWVLWSFLIGFLLPFIPWMCDRIWPSKKWILVNIPLLTIGTHPGSNQASVVIPFLLSFIFNKFLFTRYKSWWSKYNFVTASALSSGTAIATLVIIFWRNVGSDGKYISWWGNPRQGNLDYYCSGNDWVREQ